MKTFAVAMALAGLVACSATDQHPHRPPSTVAFEESDALLYVEIADETYEQQRGLMGLETLPSNQGMAFVYDGPVGSPFWMKDTRIPLSIAFVGEGGRIIGLRDMQPCEADPCPTYGVHQPYVLAIETNIGWFQEHGVDVGDRAELTVMTYG